MHKENTHNRTIFLTKIFLIFLNFVLFYLIYLILNNNIVIVDNTPIPNEIITKPPLISAKQEIQCNTISQNNLMVALTFGQSNSANHSNSRFKTTDNVYSLEHNKCFLAEDPLLDATGSGGSVWTRLGEKLIANKHYNKILFVSIGVGGSDISSWDIDRENHIKLLDTIDSIHNNGFKITHLLWHQGESDALFKRDKSRYKMLFHSMLKSIRDSGIQAPIFVSVATYNLTGINKEVQQAQKELVDINKNIYSGPNTDILGYEYRYDGVHFSDEGLDKFADLWVEKIISHN